MGPTRAVQTGMGLLAELKAAKKEQKASRAEGAVVKRDELRTEVEHLPIKPKASSSDLESSATEDEDSANDGPPLYASDSAPTSLDDDDDDEPPPYTDEELAKVPIDAKYPAPPSTFMRTPMHTPVIIPQRRPGSKTRGFLRAYAPALAQHDIDQETFLTFLKSFHKASQASPILTAITLGAGSLGQVPEPGSMLAGMGLTIMSGAAENMQQRYRTNAYLDQANENLFKPRGLYCLIMSFRPDAIPKGDVAIEAVDTSKHAMKWLDGNSLKFKTNFKNSSGTTNGETELPEPAALIYPEEGFAEIHKSKSSKDETAYSKRKVAANYFDKRAQATYAYKHPSSSLARSESTPQFASKYGDPTNKTVTTGEFGRLTSKLKHESLADRQDRKRAKDQAKRAAGGSSGMKRLGQNMSNIGPQMRAPDIIQNILYLMVVDLPTEEQMEAARTAAKLDDGAKADDSVKSEMV